MRLTGTEKRMSYLRKVKMKVKMKIVGRGSEDEIVGNAIADTGMTISPFR